MWEYIKNLFDNCIVVTFSALWAMIAGFIFPEQAYTTAAIAVSVVMLLDLMTKLFALARQSGGFLKAIKLRTISSAKFWKGTSDKIIVFIIMLIIGGSAYLISPVTDIATWFMQAIFTLMFLRDLLSIVENLSDAGISGLGIFKKKIKNKLDEACGGDSSENGEV